MTQFTEAHRDLIRHCYHSRVIAIGPSLGIGYICHRLPSHAQQEKRGPLCNLALGDTCKHYRHIPPRPKVKET